MRPTKNKKAGGGLGSQLIKRVNHGGAGRGGGQIGQFAHMFTTDLGDGRGQQMQSVLEMDDLEEMMDLAELNGRTFEAERQNVMVVSLCARSPLHHACCSSHRRTEQQVAQPRAQVVARRLSRY